LPDLARGGILKGAMETRIQPGAVAGFGCLIWVKMTRSAGDPVSSGHITVQIFVFRGNPLKYTDPNGKWFIIDDFIVAVLAKLFGNEDTGILKDTWRNLKDSYRSIPSAIEHAKYIGILFKAIIGRLKNKGLYWNHIKFGEKIDIGIDIDADWGSYLKIWEEETREKWREGDINIESITLNITIT
jgi:hypothetical protein